jgi:hypothetical protein
MIAREDRHRRSRGTRPAFFLAWMCACCHRSSCPESSGETEIESSYKVLIRFHAHSMRLRVDWQTTTRVLSVILTHLSGFGFALVGLPGHGQAHGQAHGSFTEGNQAAHIQVASEVQSAHLSESESGWPAGGLAAACKPRLGTTVTQCRHWQCQLPFPGPTRRCPRQSGPEIHRGAWGGRCAHRPRVSPICTGIMINRRPLALPRPESRPGGRRSTRATGRRGRASSGQPRRRPGLGGICKTSESRSAPAPRRISDHAHPARGSGSATRPARALGCERAPAKCLPL